MKIKRYRIFKFVQFVEYPQTEKCVKANNWLRKRTSKPQPYQIEYVRFALCVVIFLHQLEFRYVDQRFYHWFCIQYDPPKANTEQENKKKEFDSKMGRSVVSRSFYSVILQSWFQRTYFFSPNIFCGCQTLKNNRENANWTGWIHNAFETSNNSSHSNRSWNGKMATNEARKKDIYC